MPIETLCSTEPGWNLRYYVYALLTCGKSGPLDAAFATLHTLAVHHVETDAASPYNGLARVALRELAKQRTWGQ